MTDEIKDGGAAFPSVQEYQMMDGDFQRNHNLGMSLRDYFAGQAIAGLLANPNWISNSTSTPDDGASLPEIADQVADAMIAAREGKENEDE